MARLRGLLKQAVPAFQCYDLVALSAMAYSPRSGFNYAKSLGWSNREAGAVQALAKIHGLYGPKIYRATLETFSPIQIHRRVCLHLDHRNPRKSRHHCDTYADRCFCKCHFCEDCKEYQLCVVEDCYCSCHAAGEDCETCYSFHTEEDGEEDEENSDCCESCWYENCGGDCGCWCHEPEEEESGEDEEEEERVASSESENDEEDNNEDENELVASSEPDEDEEEEISPQEKLERVAARLSAASGKHYDVSLADQLYGMRRQGVAHDDGTIEITRELASIYSEDELAYILGHEYAHHMDNHIAKTEAIWELGKRQTCERARGHGFIMKSLITVVGVAATFEAVLASGRLMESEADRDSIELMHRAGYDPEAAVSAYRRIHYGDIPEADVTDVIVNCLIGTHPLPENRIEDIRREVEKYQDD